jgi:hypothetical protein
MRLVGFGLVGTVALLLLAVAPAAGAAAAVNGTVTTCRGLYSCYFVFNTSAGTGWANGTGYGYLTPGVISFQLPGDAKVTSNLTYYTSIGSLIGTYTYWVEGSFFGTDMSTGHVVYGTTDTNYTITCHGIGHGGCRYTYATDNGTIVVHLTRAEPTATTMSCSPTSIQAGSKTSCTLTVSNVWNSSNVPTGKIRLSGSFGGKFSNAGSCTLSSTGTCTFTWHSGANMCGSRTLLATYSGTAAFYQSSGATVVRVHGGC